jgi:metallo-beta-lactamase class B
MIVRLLPLLLVAAAPLQQDSWAPAIAEWSKPADPVKIADNVYYVGTGGLSAYLIADKAGHVLIDGGLPQSAPAIAASIRKLGFRLRDVKILLINHAHFDHSGGLAELKRLTGARLLASAGDKPDLEKGMTEGRPTLLSYPPVKVDQVIGDGGHIRLGKIDLTTLLTPGHTKGCTSWKLRTAVGRKPVTMLFACSLSVAGQDLKGGPAYPNAVADFRATFAKLRAEQADIFVNFHPDAFDFAAKAAKLKAGDPQAFVDAGELKRRLDASEKQFDKELAAAK